MRMILVILCVLMIIFAGGCALVAIGSGAWPVVTIPGSIVVANVLVILAVRGQRKPAFMAFFTLAGLDLLIGLPMLWVMLTNPAVTLDDPFEIGLLMLAIALVFKGVLTIAAASWLRKQGDPAVVDGNPEAENPAGW